MTFIDLHTREILELRASDAWGPTAEWTIRTFAAAIHREGRQPGAVVHDHGTHFLGQFERQLRVLEIERRRTPAALPFVNGTAERAIKSVRLEMLNHVRVRDVEELQWYLDSMGGAEVASGLVRKAAGAVYDSLLKAGMGGVEAQEVARRGGGGTVPARRTGGILFADGCGRGDRAASSRRCLR
ncbi:MAG: hypothetical protein JXQ29_05260 [Planctomycetes bacterium]|nr:hypothetical protein [Planctomycetota bacterium]